MRRARGTIFIAFLIILSSCFPTPTPTVKPPTITPSPTPPQSPPITPTPFVSPLSIPAAPISPAYILTNVLTNGGMNLPYTTMPGYSTINLPQGWSFGWLAHPVCTHNDPPGCSPVIPCPLNCILPNGNCANDEGCYWQMPEASRVLSIEYDGLRTREGNASAKAFTAGRMGQWWYYQRDQVGAGNALTFTAWLQAWMCFDYASCSRGQRSDKPTAMHLRVGIDPAGGTVITSTNVVWSAEGDAYRISKDSPNIWKLFTVTAMARARFVTVFIFANPDWNKAATDFPALYDGNYTRPNDDLYIDDARLAVQVFYPIYKIYLPMVKRR